MKSSAFTLIELMIVVAIVAFLAVLSVPQYFKYLAKARQAEVVMNLASLHTAQQVYFTQHGHYATALWGEDGLGWRPEGYKGGGSKENFYYTYGFNFSGAQEGIHFFTGKLNTPQTFLGETSATKDSFLAKAAGNLIKGKTDIWMVNENRQIENVQNGID